MKPLFEIRKFLREEKLYAYLLIGILLIYAFFLAFTERKEKQESPAITKMKKAEQTIKAKKSEREFLEEAIKDRGTAILLFSITTLFLAAMGGGLIVDAVFMANYFHKRPTIMNVRAMEPVDWGLRDLAKVIILFISFGFATSFVLGFLQKFFFKNLDDNFVILLHTTINDLAVFFMILFFVLKKYKKKLGDIGLNFKLWAKDILLGVLSYLGTLPVFITILLILLVIATLFSYEPPPHPLVEIFVEEDKRNPYLIGYSIFLACVLGPIIEEVFFRGFCYPALKKVWGMKIAMVATACFFAWIHQSTFAFWPIFVLGMVLVYIYEKRGSLLPSITLHIIHNSVFITYFFIMKRVFLDKLL